MVICTRNRAKALRLCLQAYAEIKSSQPWELVVIDNNSTDDTCEVIENAQSFLPNLIISKCIEIGLGAARDQGWRLAKGSIIAFTDDDCYPAVDFVDTHCNAYKDHPEVGFIGGSIHLWDISDIMLTVDYRKDLLRFPPRSFIPAGELQGANFSVRRKWLECVNGFDTELGAGTPFPCEDIDLFNRLSFAGAEGIFDPRPLVYHHHGRKEHDRKAMMASYDKGRGAFFMKLALRKETRIAALKAWIGSLVFRFRYGNRGEGLQASFRELMSGLRYLVRPNRSI